MRHSNSTNQLDICGIITTHYQVHQRYIDSLPRIHSSLTQMNTYTKNRKIIIISPISAFMIILRKSNKLCAISDEYRRLIMLASPSDTEIKRIEEILHLAEYDIELDELINQIDEEISRKLGLYDTEDEIISEAEQKITQAIKKSNLIKFPLSKSDGPTNYSTEYIGWIGLPKLSIPSILVGGMLVLSGLSILNYCHFSSTGKNTVIDKNHHVDSSLNSSQLNNSQRLLYSRSNIPMSKASHPNLRRDVNQHSMDKNLSILEEDNAAYQNADKLSPTSVNHSIITKKTQCYVDLKNSNPNVSKYYVLLTNLRNKAASNRLKSTIFRRIQREIEYAQIKTETEQIQAEKKQMNAESSNRNNLAQKWHLKAQISLIESQQLQCISQEALALADSP